MRGVWLTVALACATAQARPKTLNSARPAFIVAAPDRGFLGNEEIRDAYAPFAAAHRAQLVFVTDERTRTTFAEAVAALGSASRIVVLPLFLSRNESRFQRLEQVVSAGRWQVPIELTRPFGESYLAVEMLADRLRQVTQPAGRRLTVVGYGAKDETARAALSRDLAGMANRASAGLEFAAVDAQAWLDRAVVGQAHDEVAEKLVTEGARDPKSVWVPFQLGPKLDSMMSFTAALRGELHGGSTLVGADITPDPVITQWLWREAVVERPTDQELGVVILAHGSDYHWNETMRRAVEKMAARYPLELAFSMADQPVVERAVRRLEQRGARAIVVVRVFGLAQSFRAAVERMIGLDVEQGAMAVQGPITHHHGHGHGDVQSPSRIRSSCRMVTVGGLEDSPYFAHALLDRALAISKDPTRETVILVAHGAGEDSTNDHWRRVLGSLAEQMRAGRGARFRAIRFGTWREDWPDKRGPEIAAIRKMVEEAGHKGRAIVVPARTTGEGLEREFLRGLEFDLAAGFAPHPEFDKWLSAQVAEGVTKLMGSRGQDPLGGPRQARGEP